MHKQNHDHQAAATVVGINSMILLGAEVLPAGHEPMPNRLHEVLAVLIAKEADET